VPLCVLFNIADKRLDEWVDITRLMPLKDQNKEPATTTTRRGSGSSVSTTLTTATTIDASESGGRPKRKAIKDEVAALLESMKRPTSRMVDFARLNCSIKTVDFFFRIFLSPHGVTDRLSLDLNGIEARRNQP